MDELHSASQRLRNWVFPQVDKRLAVSDGGEDNAP
jgi:hypothetical protein